MSSILRKENADKHHKEMMLESTQELTNFSVNLSIIYPEEFNSKVRIENVDCVTAAWDIYNPNNNDITILNFASYTKPGGGYLNGAWAQEESLCSESNLWEILNDKNFDDFYGYNKHHTNDGLYENRAIFTPDVMFKRNGEERTFNIITCASPNYNTAIKNGISKMTICETYENRLKFIYNILKKEGQKHFVAGAWGCGVFGFPTNISKTIFEKVADIDTILAIPSGNKFKNKRSFED